MNNMTASQLEPSKELKELRHLVDHSAEVLAQAEKVCYETVTLVASAVGEEVTPPTPDTPDAPGLYGIIHAQLDNIKRKLSIISNQLARL